MKRKHLPTMEFSFVVECPITGEVMTDPVVDPEGNSYERSAIVAWLAQNPTSPVTRSPLRPAQLVPNRALREAIESIAAKDVKDRRAKSAGGGAGAAGGGGAAGA